MTEVCSESVSSCSLSSYQDVDVSFGAFEQYTQGIGSKLLTKMGYDGNGLGLNAQGMMNPIQVVGIPHYVGLGYGKAEVGEWSKIVEAREASREESKPLVLEERPLKCWKSIMKECKSSSDRDEHSKRGVKVVSPHETFIKDKTTGYNKHKYSNVIFNYEKNSHVMKNLWYAYPCTFCGLNNHYVAKCWKIKSL